MAWEGGWEKAYLPEVSMAIITPLRVVRTSVVPSTEGGWVGGWERVHS